MEEEFFKEVEIKEKNEKQKDIEILVSIANTKKLLHDANNNFEFAEGDLIDYYLYNIKANQAKLDYLIKLAKAKGIVVDKKMQIDTKKEVG